MIIYSTNKFGLRGKDMEFMQHLFSKIPETEKVILYGSRATGSFERGSDVDLAIAGKGVTQKQIAHVHFMLENESPTLLWFDVLHLDSLSNKKLRQQIEESGVVIYEKGN